MRNKTGNGHNVNVDQFLDDIKTVVRDGEELLKAGVTTAKEKAMFGARTTDKKVRQYPYQSLGVVFGLGLLAGVVISSMVSSGGSREEDEE
jgi:ElaB/YqjD/DUF883 family membrane-anchored ribosome-binding protein